MVVVAVAAVVVAVRKAKPQPLAHGYSLKMV